jgi:hypothetical protein
MKKCLDALAQIKPQPKQKSERILTIIGIALYPIWGVISSALLLNSNFIHNQLLATAVGIVFAGLLPVAMHLYEVQTDKKYFEWKTVFVSLSFGGIITIFLGSILQALLLVCGVHRILGLSIDAWYWRFPSWMLQPY